MKRTLSPEKQVQLLEKARLHTERKRHFAEMRAERQRRSAEAMAQGPDVYAKRIIASCLQVPFIHFWYSLIYIVFDYILGGHIIVKTWQKALIKAGYISEGALGVAGLWALANHTLHSYLALNPFTNSLIDPLNAFTMAAFTLIPDLILASAILVTISRYKAWINKEEKVSWLWALAYTIPTIIFACLTAYTLSTVSSLAGGGDPSKVVYASGTELQIRVLSAYFYGLIEILYAFTHKGVEQSIMAPTLPHPVPVSQVDVQAIVNEAIKAATAIVASEQKEMVADLSARLENATNLQRTQYQGLLAQVQQPVATTDPNVVADIVMQRVEQQLQALLQRQTTVAEVTRTDNPQMAALPVSQAPALLNAPQKGTQKEQTNLEREVSPPTDITTFQRRSKSTTGKTAQIFDLLNQDRNLEPVELARLAECDRTLAWRARKSWMKANNIVSDIPDTETAEEDENSGGTNKYSPEETQETEQEQQIS